LWDRRKPPPPKTLDAVDVEDPEAALAGTEDAAELLGCSVPSAPSVGMALIATRAFSASSFSRSGAVGLIRTAAKP
jgi:hypothetical protein